MRMKQFRAPLTALLVEAIISLPAIAQTTMLTGSAEQTSVAVQADQTNQAKLVKQTPIYDNRPTTIVRPQAPKIHTVYLKDNRTFWQKHPMVKGATIGAGVGAGAGALTGLVTHRGILRGAAIGAGTGAGVGVIRTSQIMKRHPIARDVATGAATGLGIGWAGSRGGHGALIGTGIGAAAGLGVGLFNNLK